MFYQKRKLNHLLFVLSLIVLGFLIGLLGVVHLHSSSLRTTDPVRSNIELKEMASSLEKEQDEYKKQISDLEKTISVDQEGLKEIKNVSEESIEELRKAKAEAGLLPLEGEGIFITLGDSGDISDGGVGSFLIHASDLRDLINLLWLAEARACSINNERVIFTSSIDCLVNTMMVNNTHVVSPYKISAIVNQKKINSFLEDDRYLVDLKNRITKNNLVFTVEYKKQVKIPAYSSTLLFNYLN
jgi:uncharacterized protein YlxW (UPF0749 family)